jgi:hypothetical protein
VRTNHSIIATLLSTFLMVVAVSGAAARRFETTEQGFLARFSPLVIQAGGAEHRVSCPLTLEGSFHSKTLSKVCGQLIGYLTRAQVPTGLEPPCQGGTATALTETLPWHILYNSFAGRLPNITSMRVLFRKVSYQIRNSGLTCQIATTEAHPAEGDILFGPRGEVGQMRLLEEFTIPLQGEVICPFAGEGKFEGAGEVFTLVTPQSRITFALVQ